MRGGMMGVHASSKTKTAEDAEDTKLNIAETQRPLRPLRFLLPPLSCSRHFVDYFAFGAHQLNPQGHLSPGVRGATQTRVVTADHGLHTVQHAGRESAAVHKVFRHLQHAAVHSQVVVASRDDEVHPTYQSLLVDLVMMEKRAPRGFAGSDPFQSVRPSDGPDMLGQNL